MTPTPSPFLNTQPPSIVSDDLKRKVARSTLKHKISSGDPTICHPNSPSSKEFIEFYRIIQEQTHQSDRNNLTDELIDNYLDSKSHQKSPWTAPISNPHNYDHRSTICRSERPVYKSPANNGIAPQPSHSNNQSTRGSMWLSDDIVLTFHPTVAHAETSIGLTRTVVKTNGSPVSVVDTLHSSREYKCSFPLCNTRWLLTAPSLDCNASPASLRQIGQCIHQQISWEDWYHYKISYDVDCKRLGSNRVTWNNMYPKKPGLPPVIAAEVERMFLVDRRVQASQAISAFTSKFCKHEFTLSNKVTKTLTYQIGRMARNISDRTVDKLPTKTMTRVYDISFLKNNFCVDYSRLSSTGFEVTMPKSEHDLLTYSQTLFSQSVLRTPTESYAYLAHRQMIILNHPDVELDVDYKKLRKEAMKQNAGDPTNTTLVFSTMSLLNLLCQCVDHDWDIQACSDSQHSTTNMKYHLLILCLVSISRDGTRQALPIGFAIGPSEKEIIAVNCFMNIVIAVRLLFGVDVRPFKGGLVSDHTYVFVNSFRKVFAGTVPLQCYPHIIRKFIINGRQGNGVYRNLLKKQPDAWLSAVAYRDVKALHHCPTAACFRYFAQLVRFAWIEAGETSLQETFFSSYVDCELFNKWYYRASGVKGYTPNNQSLESLNKLMKGSSECRGVANVKTTMSAFLKTEMPKCLNHFSMLRSNIEKHKVVLDFDYCMQQEVFRLFCDAIVPENDIFYIKAKSESFEDTWIVHDIRKLNKEKINEKSAKTFLTAFEGRLPFSHHHREDLYRLLRSYHLVRKSTTKFESSVKMYVCECKYYYNNTWCFQSAYLQHRERIKEENRRLPRIRLSYRMNKRQAQVELLKSAVHRKRVLEVSQKSGSSENERDPKLKRGGCSKKSVDETDLPNVLTQD